MDTTTRTPIVWDALNHSAWLDSPITETQRHRDAMTAQWPADTRMGYLPQSAVIHMVPADQTFGTSVTPLCGSEHPYGMVELDRVEYDVCRVCTDRYNAGATTGVLPDPFPVGTKVEFDTRLGDRASTMRGVVVEREPAFRDYRRVQVNPAGLCTEVRVENLRVVA